MSVPIKYPRLLLNSEDEKYLKMRYCTVRLISRRFLPDTSSDNASIQLSTK